LIFGLLINVGILLWSKYTGFLLIDVVGPIAKMFGYQVGDPHIGLILGISFITFHKVSFLVDSYKGRAVPPRNFLDCALYIFLFPQLIAGPIIRYHDIGEQIHERSLSAHDVMAGLLRFSVGFAKKTLIADPLGGVADKIFGYQAAGLPVEHVWLGIAAYTLQIYFDFSGYSDMAVGLGRMMGFRFPENFNRPYISRSIGEFWQRWHISLSRWMRVYLYIPLGGNRASPGRVFLNLWIVFLISGIWHGASWNFVVWGAYYGLFLSVERWVSLSRFSVRFPSIVAQVYTLLVVMCGWVLFRSSDLSYALDYLGVMFGMVTPIRDPAVPDLSYIMTKSVAVTMVIAIVLAVMPEVVTQRLAAWKDSFLSRRDIFSVPSVLIKFSTTAFLLIASSMAMLSSGYAPFLYFRF
jgi:alginate O-acetyltransferase complex protein AlgI